MREYERLSDFPGDVYPFNNAFKLEGEFYGRVIDVNDPSGTGSIKVHIPELMQGIPVDQGIWVLMIHDQEGIKSTPAINKVVIITFRDGDPNVPMFRGIVRHWDEANSEVNPKTSNRPNPNPKPESFDTDELMYGPAGANSDMNRNDNKTLAEAAYSYMPIKTPRLGHFDRFMDGYHHSFIERKTHNGNTLVLSDDGNYALMHAIGDNQVMAHSAGYVEMSATNGTHSVHANGKDKYILMKSGKNLFVVLDDKTKSVISFSGMGSDGQRAAGTSADILHKDPMDRFAPSVKVRSLTRFYGMPAVLNSISHSVQVNSDIGSMGISKRGTGGATDYHLRSGFILHNCL